MAKQRIIDYAGSLIPMEPPKETRETSVLGAIGLGLLLLGGLAVLTVVLVVAIVVTLYGILG